MKRILLILALITPVFLQALSGTWASTLSINGISATLLTGHNSAPR